MVGASCFIQSWHWADMYALKGSQSHVSTLLQTHTDTSGPHAHQAPSWSFMGSLFHLPQGHQVTLIQREAKLATVGHTPGSAQGANYA